MNVDDLQSCLGDLMQDWKGSVRSLLYDEANNKQADSLEANLKELAEAADVPAYWLVLSDMVQVAKDAVPQPTLKLASDEPAVDESTAAVLGADVAEPILVENAKADPQEFGVLYERYMDRIYSYIYRRVGNTQDTEDLTAHTFTKALDKLNSYEDRGYPFSAWLFRIAHNLVANWHRDSGRRRFLPMDRLWGYSSDTETPDQQVERDEKHTALWDAINRLPPERRDLLVYKFSNCLSNVEIGALMNKSESAIKSLYFRTLAALRQDLEATEMGR